jgi:hypothetical protein
VLNSADSDAHQGDFRPCGGEAEWPSYPTIPAHNEKGKPFKWTKTADEILDKMRRFGLRTQQVHAQ